MIGVRARRLVRTAKEREKSCTHYILFFFHFQRSQFLFLNKIKAEPSCLPCELLPWTCYQDIRRRNIRKFDKSINLSEWTVTHFELRAKGFVITGLFWKVSNNFLGIGKATDASVLTWFTQAGVTTVIQFIWTQRSNHTTLSLLFFGAHFWKPHFLFRLIVRMQRRYKKLSITKYEGI